MANNDVIREFVDFSNDNICHLTVYLDCSGGFWQPNICKEYDGSMMMRKDAGRTLAGYSPENTVQGSVLEVLANLYELIMAHFGDCCDTGKQTPNVDEAIWPFAEDGAPTSPIFMAICGLAFLDMLPSTHIHAHIHLYDTYHTHVDISIYLYIYINRYIGICIYLISSMC